MKYWSYKRIVALVWVVIGIIMIPFGEHEVAFGCFIISNVWSASM